MSILAKDVKDERNFLQTFLGKALPAAHSQEPISAWEQAQQEFSCAHNVQRLAVKVGTNGSRYYRMQCQHCGESVRQVHKAGLSEAEMEDAAPFDEAKLTRFRENKSARYHELYEIQRRQEFGQQEQEKREWWRRYSLYLETPAWKAKSRHVIERDVTCQACLSRPAVQAHHLTYRHVGNEPLFDLVGVCLECHKKLHDPDAVAFGLRRNFDQAGVCVS
jgi:hypothetical protein